MPPTHALAPGLRVVRRGRDLLQVGLTEPRRVVLPRSEAVRDVLHALQVGRRPRPGPEVDHVLDVLHRHDCLVSGGRDLPVRLAVQRLGDWPVDLDPVLRRTGTCVAALDAAEGVLVLSVGEPDRARLDPLVRTGTPHLLVVLADGGARLGPLVEPGLTACQRCLDAHTTEDDPDHPAVLARYVEAAARRREDGRDDVADPALAVLVTAWAVRDLVAHVDRSRPVSASLTRTWHAGAAEPEVRRWRRRADCGCGWAPSGTMEA